jgi:integrase
MPTLSAVIDGFVASRDHWDAGTLARLEFWVSALGSCELTEITPEQVDDALVTLAERGRLRPSRAGTLPAGKPLAGATINRHVAQLGSVYAYARRLRVTPRSFIPPTRGVERSPEPPDPDRYLTEAQVDRLQAVARVIDTNWGKFEALIRVLATTGLRIGNVMALRWKDVDLERRTLSVARTKNGTPFVAAMPEKTAAALAALPGKQFPGALVFCGRTGRPYKIRRIWKKAVTEIGVPRATPHWLRHHAGHTLAKNGVPQPMIMKILNHKSLAASSRYFHASVDDRREIADKVFG